jgi:hypothetical protein
MKNKKSELEESARLATQTIADAAKSATQAIADAALSATKLLSTQALEAAKLTNEKNNKVDGDHDLIIELKTIVVGIKADIQKLSDGTASRITHVETEKLNINDSYALLYKTGVEERQTDHEARIRMNSENITQIKTWGTAGILLIGVVEFLINLYIRK